MIRRQISGHGGWRGRYRGKGGLAGLGRDGGARNFGGPKGGGEARVSALWRWEDLSSRGVGRRRCADASMGGNFNSNGVAPATGAAPVQLHVAPYNSHTAIRTRQCLEPRAHEAEMKSSCGSGQQGSIGIKRQNWGFRDEMGTLFSHYDRLGPHLPNGY